MTDDRQKTGNVPSQPQGPGPSSQPSEDQAAKRGEKWLGSLEPDSQKILDVLGFLQSLDPGSGGSVLFQFIALFTTMALAGLLGMGMPAVPAYINVALLMGPWLAGLGLSIFTANMFIFYFAVASAITPPVAIAAFTAATITKAKPMATGFSAVNPAS